VTEAVLKKVCGVESAGGAPGAGPLPAPLRTRWTMRPWCAHAAAVRGSWSSPGITREAACPSGSGAVGRVHACHALRAGVQAAAEVALPPAADFAGGAPAGSLRRLLVLDGVQDPGNMVGRPPPGARASLRLSVAPSATPARRRYPPHSSGTRLAAWPCGTPCRAMRGRGARSRRGNTARAPLTARARRGAGHAAAHGAGAGLGRRAAAAGLLRPVQRQGAPRQPRRRLPPPARRWRLGGAAPPARANATALRRPRAACLPARAAATGWPVWKPLRDGAARAAAQDLDAIAQRHGLACLAADPHSESDGAAPAAASTASSAQGAAHGGGAAGAPAGRLDAAVEGAAVALVLGSEGRGLGAGAGARCRPVGVPMPGAMESLNVAQAGAVLMAALSPGLPALLRQLYGPV